MKEVIFEDELRCLLNRFSMGNGSNTADFILAKFLRQCLNAFDLAVSDREFHKTAPPNLAAGAHITGGQAVACEACGAPMERVNRMRCSSVCCDDHNV